MNTALANISDFLGPVAFVMGFLLVYSCWQRRNPVLFIFAVIVFCYQLRGVIGSVSVLITGAALVRPSGLLATTIVGRLIEICGSTIGWLYMSNKLEFQGLIGMFLSPEQMARPEMRAGDMPPEYWIEKQVENAYLGCKRALDERMR